MTDFVRRGERAADFVDKSIVNCGVVEEAGEKPREGTSGGFGPGHATSILAVSALGFSLNKRL